MGRRQLRGRRASSARTPTQVAKIVAVRERLPQLQHDRRRSTPAGDAPTRSRSTSCARAAASATRRSSTARRDARRPGGRVHVHLHLRHDRPAEGLRAHARQLPRRCSTWSSERGRARGRGRRRLPLPAARARLRAADPARRVRRRRDDRLLRRRHASRSSPSSRRSSRPTSRRCRASSRRSTRSPRRVEQIPEEQIEREASTLGVQGPRPRGAAASRSRRSCRAASTRPTSRLFAERRARSSAAACARPSPAPRRSRRRSSSSSTPAASRCSRATA